MLDNNINKNEKKELTKEEIEAQLSILEPSDILEITERIDDHLVPREVASKLKGVSHNAIQKAINRGVLREVGGITLKSLLEYKVDGKRRNSGRIAALNRLKEKVKELENKELQDDK